MSLFLLVFALVLPAATSKATAPPRANGKLLDCTSHSVWSAPDGWTTVRAGTETVAVSPDNRAALVRTAVRSERGRTVKISAVEARAIAARIAGGELTWS